MKKILVMVAALGLIASSALAASGKIAFVDTQTVFDKTKIAYKYKALVREYFESRKQLTDMKAEALKTLNED